MGGVLLKLGDDLPPLRSPDAVGHRQLLPLLGGKIVRLMGIPGKKDGLSPVESIHHPPHHVGYNVSGLLRPQGTGDEVVLHIHNHQYIHM